ncbi:MAG: hypothetical protein AAF363_12520 [Bacteroidota bacterium]
MKRIGDNLAINTLGIIHLSFRVIILISLIFLYTSGGYDPIEFDVLFFCILPISVVYLASFIRFWVKYPYTISLVRVINRRYLVELVFFSALYLAYLCFIWLNPWHKDYFPFEVYKWIILIFEMVNAIFLATRLAYLFAIREN